MKNILIFIFTSVSFSLFGQTTSDEEVFNECANILYEQVNPLDTLRASLFTVENGKPFGFHIYDITDTSKNSRQENFSLIKDHVYIFTAPYYQYLYCNVLINTDEKEFFKAINCYDSGDDLSSVIFSSYFKKLKTDEKEILFGRIINYKEYSLYIKRDQMTKVVCDRIW